MDIKLLITYLLILMVIDYISALFLVVCKKRELSSKTGYKGICKKVVTILLVGVSEIASLVFNYPTIASVVCVAYIINEMLSIIENARELGVKTPKQLKELIDANNKEEHNEDKQDSSEE